MGARGSWTPTAAAAGLAVVAGIALPVAWGWAPPLVAIGVAAVLGHLGGRAVRRWIADASAGPGHGWAARVRQLSPVAQASTAALAILGSAVAVATLATGVGAVLVAFPAAAFALLALPVAGLAGRTPGRGQLPARLLGAFVVLGAGVVGTRYEAAHEEARGWAESGPILGIHPFQTTSVIVDGRGPYDIPFNDYIEPDGSRGYDPTTYADALERALHAIAQQHYAHGPARAHMAFAEATVEPVTTDAVRENLDREPTAPTQSRVVVRSGTTGQRSRVEFVCPGKPDDPSGPAPERILNRMCPNKYVSEASAGLGLTGRWSGYVEARGNERFGLSRMFGWTRSDDEPGRTAVTWEVRLWGFLVLAIAAAVGLRKRSAAADAITAASGATVVLFGVVAAWVLLRAGPSLSVHALESPPAYASWADARAWLPLTLVAVATGGLGGDAGRWRGSWAVVIAVATLAVGSFVAADAWVRPALVQPADAPWLFLERFVGAAADAIGPRAGLSILEIEGAVAGVVLVALLGAAVAIVRRLDRLDGPDAGLGILAAGPWVRVGAVVLAVAFVVSRKTDGGAALMPAAMMTFVVVGSGLWLSAGAPVGWRRAVHLCVVAAGLWTLGQAIAAAPSHPFVTTCAAVGGLAFCGALAFLTRVGPAAAPVRADSEPPDAT